jgi:uncharacterized protein YegP (UPF0339 family)
VNYPKVIVYRDDSGNWRWRRVARNGRITAASEEGVRSKWYCRIKAKLSNPGLTPDRFTVE